MKKYLSVFICVLMIVSVCVFASCGKKAETDNNTTKPAVSDETTDAGASEANGEKCIPEVTFTVDKEEVKPGEAFTVTFRISDAKWLACYSTELTFNTDVLTCRGKKTFSADGYYDMMNNLDSGLLYYGYVAETIDIDDADILSVTFTVSEDAEVGTETEVALNIDEMKLGIDKGGAETYDVWNSYETFTVKVKIA